MRLAFMGTPDFAVPTLERLIAARHEILAVYTQPPRPAGRGKGLTPSPVQRCAEKAGIEVRAPITLRDSREQNRFAELRLDAAVVAAYGLILPTPVLEAPGLGCLNVHASLLPRWRGAAPIQRAILAGDEKTGVSIMAMERGLDTGPVYCRQSIAIADRTAGELTAELAELGARLMAESLDRIDSLDPEPQSEQGVTYAAKVGKEEARLDFGQPAVAVERRIRAFNPAPGAWFAHRGERVRILAASVVPDRGLPGMVLDESLTIACGEGAIRPGRVQRAGRAPMSTVELLRGFPVPPGTALPSEPR